MMEEGDKAQGLGEGAGSREPRRHQSLEQRKLPVVVPAFSPSTEASEADGSQGSLANRLAYRSP